MYAGFFLKVPDPDDLASSLAATGWLRMIELMHEMQQKHMHGLVEGELPSDVELAEEALHQVRMYSMHVLPRHKTTGLQNSVNCDHRDAQP